MSNTPPIYPPEVLALIDAMDDVLDDMRPEGQSVCLAVKAKARVAFEPFVDEEVREMYMDIDEARAVLREVGLA